MASRLLFEKGRHMLRRWYGIFVEKKKILVENQDSVDDDESLVFFFVFLFFCIF
jgi:hypothetical protein